jgi:hypothetical protein
MEGNNHHQSKRCFFLFLKQFLQGTTGVFILTKEGKQKVSWPVGTEFPQIRVFVFETANPKSVPRHRHLVAPKLRREL